MADTNTVTISGNITKDAEAKTAGGWDLISFSVANNYSKKDGNEWTKVANFFNVKFFVKDSSKMLQYLIKGTKVAVTGKLRQDTWKDKEGNNRTSIHILANMDGIDVFFGKSEGSGQQQPNQNTQPRQRPSSDSRGGAAASPPVNFEDDIPF
jgi:single-strand DNA-binding protein